MFDKNRKTVSEEPVVAPSNNPSFKTETGKVDDHSVTGTTTGIAKVKAQPVDPSYVSDPKEKRIEFLKAKSDRTLEEGLELQELELGLKKSKEINAGITSVDVHNQQMKLRAAEKNVKAEAERKEREDA